MWNLVIGMSSALTGPEPARWARDQHISVSHNPVMEALTLSKVQSEIFQKLEIFRATQPSAEIFLRGIMHRVRVQVWKEENLVMAFRY